MANYHIEDIYQGGYSSLDSSAGGFTGYRVSSGKIGMATDPRTADILKEVSTKLQSGAKQIEVSQVQADVFESIPKQQLKEIKRLSELTGVDISVHAPLTDPSGISQQGYNELAREEAERQMFSAIEKSHEMSRKGNVPVTFHSSAGWQGPEYKKLEQGEEKGKIPIINQETGQISLTQTERRYYPSMNEEELKKGRKISAETQNEIRNNTEWEDSISTLVAVRERANRMIQETEPIFREIRNKIDSGTKMESLTSTEKDVYMRYSNASIELSNIHMHLSSLFDRAYKYGNGGEKKELIKISQNFRNSLPKDPLDLKGQSRAMAELMQNLNSIEAPEVYKPLEEFALDKAASTFGNIAFKSYKKFKDEAPIISIENPPVGMGLSRAEDLKKLVETARDKFVQKAVQEGISEGKARSQANKLIGVTWDVGHINMIRKYGYEKKDVIKEAEKVAPFVKHIHLSDNFGFEHTELPMGMGNVPIKEIMEKLGEKGFEAQKVIEAGNWWQHFKTSPFQGTLEAFGSPIYGMKMAPYWNQSIGVQGYFGGYGQILPPVNYETMGAGFSTLPAELGGQRQGAKGSRMSGRAME